MLFHDQVPGWDEISEGPKALFVRFAPEADREATSERLQDVLQTVGRFPGSAHRSPCSARRRS
jgi:hypothetical protein